MRLVACASLMRSKQALDELETTSGYTSHKVCTIFFFEFVVAEVWWLSQDVVED